MHAAVPSGRAPHHGGGTRRSRCLHQRRPQLLGHPVGSRDWPVDVGVAGRREGDYGEHRPVLAVEVPEEGFQQGEEERGVGPRRGAVVTTTRGGAVEDVSRTEYVQIPRVPWCCVHWYKVVNGRDLVRSFCGDLYTLTGGLD